MDWWEDSILLLKLVAAWWELRLGGNNLSCRLLISLINQIGLKSWCMGLVEVDPSSSNLMGALKFQAPLNLTKLKTKSRFVQNTPSFGGLGKSLDIWICLATT